MSVCLSAHLSKKPHFTTLQNFLYMLPEVWLDLPLMTVQYIIYFWLCGQGVFT